MATKKKKAEFQYPTSSDPAGEFYIRLGAALGEWQMVEFWLFHVYWILLGTPTRDIAAISYYQITQIRKLLEIVDELAKHRLGNGPLRPDWNQLNGQIKRVIKNRNDMVHITFMSVNRGGSDWEFIGVPPFLDPKYRDTIFNMDFVKNISQKALTLRKLDQYRSNFSCAHKNLQEFFGKIRRFFPPPKASP